MLSRVHWIGQRSRVVRGSSKKDRVAELSWVHWIGQSSSVVMGSLDRTG